MPILKNLIEYRYSIKDIAKALGAGMETHSGISVDPDKALRYSAVYGCITIIADVFAENRKILYRRLQPRGRERAHNHPLYRLLHEAPNPEMDAFTFDQTRMGHVLGWGNSYVEIDWDMNTGRVRGLWPLNPAQMRVVRENGVVWYYYKTPDGIEHRLPSFRIWHMPGYGFDGLIGYSPISLAKESIGLGLAAEEFKSRFYSQGSHMGMVASHPKSLSDQGSKNLERSLNNQYAGLGKSHRIMVLEEGLKIEKIGINPADAQVLEERAFQVIEICRRYRVPPHLIGATDKTTSWGTGIEQQNIGFLIYTIQPWHTRNELSASLKLLGPEERKTYYIEAMVDNLLRGDSASRAEYTSKMFTSAGITPNEIREKNNLPLHDDPNADKLFVPANMVPIDAAGTGDNAPSADGRNLENIIKKIAGRERENILGAARKYNDTEFQKWLADFYRDFVNYISRQVSPVVDNGDRYAADYVARSQGLLDGVTPATAEKMLESWEEKQAREA